MENSKESISVNKKKFDEIIQKIPKSEFPIQDKDDYSRIIGVVLESKSTAKKEKKSINTHFFRLLLKSLHS